MLDQANDYGRVIEQGLARSAAFYDKYDLNAEEMPSVDQVGKSLEEALNGKRSTVSLAARILLRPIFADIQLIPGGLSVASLLEAYNKKAGSPMIAQWDCKIEDLQHEETPEGWTWVLRGATDNIMARTYAARGADRALMQSEHPKFVHSFLDRLIKMQAFHPYMISDEIEDCRGSSNMATSLAGHGAVPSRCFAWYSTTEAGPLAEFRAISRVDHIDRPIPLQATLIGPVL